MEQNFNKNHTQDNIAQQDKYFPLFIGRKWTRQSAFVAFLSKIMLVMQMQVYSIFYADPYPFIIKHGLSNIKDRSIPEINKMLCELIVPGSKRL